MARKRQLSGAALTANVIKKRLTALFPKVKFSVRSDTFSMGDSVDISWTDGPRTETVDAITKQYQNGRFDSMQDLYEYKKIDPALGCDGAKYVQCHRILSAVYKAALAEKAIEHYGLSELDPGDNDYFGKITEIEQLFFQYKESETAVTFADGNAVMSGLEYTVTADVDTRDNSDIFVVKIITKIENFNSMRQALKPLGGYYSRYKKGFIFKDDPTERLRGGSKDADNGLPGTEHNIGEEVCA